MSARVPSEEAACGPGSPDAARWVQRVSHHLGSNEKTSRFPSSAGCEAGGGGKVGFGEQPAGVVGDGCGEVHQADGLRASGQNISGAGTGFCPGSSVSAGLESATPGGKGITGGRRAGSSGSTHVPTSTPWGL